MNFIDLNLGPKDKLTNYLTVSRNLAKYEHKVMPFVLARILAARLIYGMGASAYERRRFSDKALRRSKEYINLQDRERLQQSLCPRDSWGLADNKLLFHERCLSRGLPTPAIHGAFMTGEGYVPEGIPALRSREDLERFLRRLRSGMYVVKPLCAAHGLGISVYRISDGTVDEVQGGRIGTDALLRKMDENRYESYCHIFQEFARPHPGLKPIMSGEALGTIRIVTFFEGERTVHIPFGVVKIPVNGGITDNFGGGYSGNWVCPLDVVSGRLGNAVGKTAAVPVFSEIERHPETGAVFRETSIPLWKEVRSTLRDAALAFSELKAIGWDIAVTDKGVSIIEANRDWGANIIDVAHNRGLKKEMTEWTRKSRMPGEI